MSNLSKYGVSRPPAKSLIAVRIDPVINDLVAGRRVIVDGRPAIVIGRNIYNVIFRHDAGGISEVPLANISIELT